MPTHPAVPSLTAALPNGGSMPLLGFGTWQITGADATRTTAAALEAGYRHIDTATLYTNEAEVGVALTESGIERSELFVVTKLPGNDVTDPAGKLEDSLRKLQTDYLDLWLIHWPTGEDTKVWDFFRKAQDDERVRDVGVSNFSLEAIDELSRSGVSPAVNQIPLSPLNYSAELVAGHRERGVVVEGYSALRGGTLENPVIGAIASRLDRTPAQVILRWHLQHEIVAIPKSLHEERIISNAQIADFALTDEDMTAIDGLSGTASAG